MLVGCVSFDWHTGLPFFTSETHVVISSMCLHLILSTPLALSLSLSPQKLGHSCSYNNTRSLSLSLSLSPQKVLARSVCSDVPAGLSSSPPPAVHALRIARRRKGPERKSTAPSTAPPILLLGLARFVESPRHGGN
jgi:hypothetical protein